MTMTTLSTPEDLSPEQMTLDEVRPLIARALPAHAAFDGWSHAALAAAAADVGIPAERARLIFPGGATEMIDAWIFSADEDMARALAESGPLPASVTARIRACIWMRLEQAAPWREAVRRAVAILSMPQNAMLSARILWRSADAMWRVAGDTAVDFNHYTKRLTLGGVYAATLLVWLNDDSEGFSETADFLDRRLAGVGRFEKFKAGFRKSGENRPSLTRFLGRLRYPAI